MVVPGHVEGRESGATTLHGAGYSRGGKRHSQAAVRRQRSLDGMRNGCSYGCSAGTQGTQRLWMLKSRKTGWGGHPGTEGQVIRCCKGWPCKQRERMPDICTATHKAGKLAKREKESLSQKDKLSLEILPKYFSLLISFFILLFASRWQIITFSLHLRQISILRSWLQWLEQ